MPGIAATMDEWKKGKLRSGSKKGPVVKSRKQAIAIGLSEDRKAGKKVARKPRSVRGDAARMSTDEFEKKHGDKRIDR